MTEGLNGYERWEVVAAASAERVEQIIVFSGNFLRGVLGLGLGILWSGIFLLIRGLCLLIVAHSTAAVSFQGQKFMINDLQN